MSSDNMDVGDETTTGFSVGIDKLLNKDYSGDDPCSVKKPSREGLDI